MSDTTRYQVITDEGVHVTDHYVVDTNHDDLIVRRFQTCREDAELERDRLNLLPDPTCDICGEPLQSAAHSTVSEVRGRHEFKRPEPESPGLPERPRPLAGDRWAPDGRHFPWGPIDETHVIGPYCVVEFRRDASRMDRSESWTQHNETQFHTYVRRDTLDGWTWDDTHHSWHSLDAALAHAIAYRAEGPNGRAHSYFIKMIDGEL